MFRNHIGEPRPSRGDSEDVIFFRLPKVKSFTGLVEVKPLRSHPRQ